MKKLYILISLVFTMTLFSATHKIAIDARDYSVGEIDITRAIVANTKIILDEDTADAVGGGEWDLQVTESGSLAISVEAANDFQAEKLIQVCMNAFNEVANGTETYARTTNTTENDLATKVQSNVVSFLGLNDRGVKDFAGDATANMEVIKLYPGFMDNTNDNNTMTSDIGKKNIAKGILFGLQEHFGFTAYDPNEIHDITDPVITINSHTDNQTVNTASITFTGSVTDDILLSLVKINNAEIALNGDNFSKEISLTEGANSIEVYAEDSSGNNTTETININLVILDTTAPVIRFQYPSNNATVALQDIEMKGIVEDTQSGVKDFKINNQVITLDANGIFTHAVTLVEGLNTFQLIAEDNDGNIRNEEHKVTYEIAATDTSPPVISVVTPSDNEIINIGNINVAGSIDDESPISAFTINGINVELSINNEFSLNLNLSEGSNEIKFYARDSFDNQVAKTITVTYNPSATDTTPPIITITSPDNNQKFTSPNITITGNVVDTNEVNSFTINSSLVPLNNNSEFTYNAVLTIGENRFEFKSKDNSDNESSKILILYLESHQNSAPEIIITSPRDGETVYQDNVDIKGTVRDSDGVKYLSMNNYMVSVDGENKFSFNLPLTEGNNQIIIEASDNIDNKSKVILNITYKLTETQKDDGDSCNFNNNNNKNFTNTVIFLMMMFILYFRKKWIIKNRQ